MRGTRPFGAPFYGGPRPFNEQQRPPGFFGSAPGHQGGFMGPPRMPPMGPGFLRPPFYPQGPPGGYEYEYQGEGEGEDDGEYYEEKEPAEKEAAVYQHPGMQPAPQEPFYGSYQSEYAPQPQQAPPPQQQHQPAQGYQIPNQNFNVHQVAYSNAPSYPTNFSQPQFAQQPISMSQNQIGIPMLNTQHLMGNSMSAQMIGMGNSQPVPIFNLQLPVAPVLQAPAAPGGIFGSGNNTIQSQPVADTSDNQNQMQQLFSAISTAEHEKQFEEYLAKWEQYYINYQQYVQSSCDAITFQQYNSQFQAYFSYLQYYKTALEQKKAVRKATAPQILPPPPPPPPPPQNRPPQAPLPPPSVPSQAARSEPPVQQLTKTPVTTLNSQPSAFGSNQNIRPSGPAQSVSQYPTSLLAGQITTQVRNVVGSTTSVGAMRSDFVGQQKSLHQQATPRFPGPSSQQQVQEPQQQNQNLNQQRPPAGNQSLQQPAGEQHHPQQVSQQGPLGGNQAQQQSIGGYQQALQTQLNQLRPEANQQNIGAMRSQNPQEASRQNSNSRDGPQFALGNSQRNSQPLMHQQSDGNTNNQMADGRMLGNPQNQSFVNQRVPDQNQNPVQSQFRKNYGSVQRQLPVDRPYQNQPLGGGSNQQQQGNQQPSLSSFSDRVASILGVASAAPARSAPAPTSQSFSKNASFQAKEQQRNFQPVPDQRPNDSGKMLLNAQHAPFSQPRQFEQTQRPLPTPERNLNVQGMGASRDAPAATNQGIHLPELHGRPQDRKSNSINSSSDAVKQPPLRSSNRDFSSDEFASDEFLSVQSEEPIVPQKPPVQSAVVNGTGVKSKQDEFERDVELVTEPEPVSGPVAPPILAPPSVTSDKFAGIDIGQPSYEDDTGDWCFGRFGKLTAEPWIDPVADERYAKEQEECLFQELKKIQQFLPKPPSPLRPQQRRSPPRHGDDRRRDHFRPTSPPLRGPNRNANDFRDERDPRNSAQFRRHSPDGRRRSTDGRRRSMEPFMDRPPMFSDSIIVDRPDRRGFFEPFMDRGLDQRPFIEPPYMDRIEPYRPSAQPYIDRFEQRPEPLVIPTRLDPSLPPGQVQLSPAVVEKVGHARRLMEALSQNKPVSVNEILCIINSVKTETLVSQSQPQPPEPPKPRATYQPPPARPVPRQEPREIGQPIQSLGQPKFQNIQSLVRSQAEQNQNMKVSSSALRAQVPDVSKEAKLQNSVLATEKHRNLVTLQQMPEEEEPPKPLINTEVMQQLGMTEAQIIEAVERAKSLFANVMGPEQSSQLVGLLQSTVFGGLGGAGEASRATHVLERPFVEYRLPERQNPAPLRTLQTAPNSYDFNREPPPQTFSRDREPAHSEPPHRELQTSFPVFQPPHPADGDVNRRPAPAENFVDQARARAFALASQGRGFFAKALQQRGQQMDSHPQASNSDPHGSQRLSSSREPLFPPPHDQLRSMPAQRQGNRRTDPSSTDRPSQQGQGELRCSIIPLEDVIPRGERMQKKLAIILRGPPGTGKSWVARRIKELEPETRILSMDDFFQVEREVGQIDSKGRHISRKISQYEFDENCVERYRRELDKTFRKKIDDSHCSCIVVDSSNEKLAHFMDMVMYGCRNGYEVVVGELPMAKPYELERRSTHHRSASDIAEILRNWEATPSSIWRVDLSKLVAAMPTKMDESPPEDDDRPKLVVQFNAKAPPLSKWEIDREETPDEWVEKSALTSKGPKNVEWIEKAGSAVKRSEHPSSHSSSPEKISSSSKDRTYRSRSPSPGLGFKKKR